jgi:hypothetical protein
MSDAGAAQFIWILLVDRTKMGPGMREDSLSRDQRLAPDLVDRQLARRAAA